MDVASTVRLFLLAAIWGASFLFMRIGVPVFGPIALILLRVSIAACFLWLASLWLRKKLQLGRYWKHYLTIGVLNSALPFLLFAYAAQTLSASLLSIFNATAPLFGALIGALWLRTPMSRSILCGLVCGFAGVAVLASQGANLAGDGDGWLALAAGLLAPLLYGLASTYTKAAASSASPFGNAHGSMWMATLTVIPLLFFAPLREAPSAADWSAVGTLGILCTGAAYLLFFRLIEDVGPTRALSVTFLIPVFGVLWGALFLDEAIGWETLFGGMLIFAGIALTGGMLKLPGGRS